ncbi:hypothetical protein K3727_09475 [Rhodobacteraceae bacterium M382]|nr:hypothetical protein K3727_09475 [Rhodobacteraceae bacterium M382]
MLEAVADRLKSDVPGLGNRVDPVASLSDLLRKNKMPETTTTFVVPLGITGGKADAMTGLFRQEIRETIGVLLIARSRDRTGEKAIAHLRDLSRQIIDCLVGWNAGLDLGVFELRRAGVVSMTGGDVIYQVELSINDQLRIPR